MATSLTAKRRTLPKTRRKKMARRATALIAESKTPRIDYSDIPASTPAQLASMRRVRRRRRTQGTHQYAVALIAYRVTITPEKNGTLVVTCPGFPSVVTAGATEAEALESAHDALATIIDAYIRDQRALPPPTLVRTCAEDAVVGDGVWRRSRPARIGWEQEAAAVRLADLGGQFPITTPPRRRRSRRTRRVARR